MTPSYSFLQVLVRSILRIFFRKIDVSGLENIPSDQGGLFISWHPNGMIDPGLLFAFSPKRVVFGARHGLFAWPLLGRLMKIIDAVPMYRGQDVQNWSSEKRRKYNAQSLTQLADAMTSGAYAALFPEGVSHDAPFVHRLKTGAARIYYQSRRQMDTEKPPVIIPVGLHYDRKQRFRSNVLLRFHPPLCLPHNLDIVPDMKEEDDCCQRLTDVMEAELSKAIFATESWTAHQNFHCAARLIAAERRKRAGNEDTERTLQEHVLGVSRIWLAYQQKSLECPEACEQLVLDVQEYREDLDSLGIDSFVLDGMPRLFFKRIAVLALLQWILYGVLLPPLVLVGYVINLPPTILVKYLSLHYSNRKKDHASVKLFSSLILYPLTWTIWSFGAYFGLLQSSPIFPSMPDSAVWAFGFVFCISIVGNVLMFTFVRAGQRTRRVLKMYLKKARRYDVWLHLREERARLYEELVDMAGEISLPGSVGKDGRLRE